MSKRVSGFMASGRAYGAALSVCMAAALGQDGGQTRNTEPQQKPAVKDAAPPAKSFVQEVAGAAYSFEMVLVPGSADGSIKPFYIGKTELGWEALDAYVFHIDEKGRDAPARGDPDAQTRPSKPYVPPDRGFGHEGYAAISVSERTATAFCEWLSKKTGRKWRLPTEAEWEHAALAGGKPPVGIEDVSKLGEFAWFRDNAEGTTHPVGKKKANAFGLHDVWGNAAEWVSGRDGTYVLKGGSYRDPAERLEVSRRAVRSPSWQTTDPQVPKSIWWLSDAPFAGFRVVCEVEQSPAQQVKPGASGGEEKK